MVKYGFPSLPTMLRSHCQPCGDQAVLCYAMSPQGLVPPKQAIKDPGQMWLRGVWLTDFAVSRHPLVPPNSCRGEQKVAICATTKIGSRDASEFSLQTLLFFPLVQLCAVPETMTLFNFQPWHSRGIRTSCRGG